VAIGTGGMAAGPARAVGAGGAARGGLIGSGLEQQAERFADDVVAGAQPRPPTSGPLARLMAMNPILGSPGDPLPADLADDLARRTGTGLSAVRVYELPASVAAITRPGLSFSAGSAIVLSPGLSPARRARALAHEIALRPARGRPARAAVCGRAGRRPGRGAAQRARRRRDPGLDRRTGHPAAR